MKFDVIVDRLKEPSTWAGLAGLALIFGLPQEVFLEYVTAITGALAFVAIVMKEGDKGEENVEETEE
jgi:hypothetical protein